jgi:hypothetical protein
MFYLYLFLNDEKFAIFKPHTNSIPAVVILHSFILDVDGDDKEK